MKIKASKNPLSRKYEKMMTNLFLQCGNPIEDPDFIDIMYNRIDQWYRTRFKCEFDPDGIAKSKFAKLKNIRRKLIDVAGDRLKLDDQLENKLTTIDLSLFVIVNMAIGQFIGPTGSTYRKDNKENVLTEYVLPTIDRCCNDLLEMVMSVSSIEQLESKQDIISKLKEDNL